MRATVIALLLAAATTASAQTSADGWSGQVQCVLATRGTSYQDDQTHTWVLSGAPVVRNDFRDYRATWTVSGRGTRTAISARAAGAGAGDSWTHSGSDAGASITLFVPVGTTTMRISPGQRAVKIANGIRGTSASVAFAGDASEWRFQPIEIANGGSQTSLSGSRTQTRTDLIGWRPPTGSTVTETCSWNLAKSGSVSAGADAKGGAAGAAAAGGGAAKPTGIGTAISAGASTKSGGAAGGGATKPPDAGSASTAGAAVGGAASGGNAKGGATSGTSTTTSNPDVTRQY